MATILWEHEIDKTVDWGGDISTGGAPVSGKYVQQFIKDTLAKKWGYLYFDRANLKYLVFADESDYIAYTEDPVGNSAMLLASFDAPAPADISIISKSADNTTTLLSATGRKIEFNYYILDKSQNPVSENVSFRAVINHAGEQQVYTDTIKPDMTIQTVETEDGSKQIANYANKNVGTKYTFPLDSYLTEEGTYTITVTLTGMNTQASTTLTFIYTVVELSLVLPDFKYYEAFSTAADSYEIPYVATGAAGINKLIEIYIDGELLYQRGVRNAISSGDSIGSAGTIPDTITLFNKNDNGEIIRWDDSIATSSLWNKAIFKEGKHTLQLRVSIPGDDAPFYSNTEYFEFVVVDPESILSKTYLLYATETPAGTIFESGQEIALSGQQYTAISLSVAVIDTRNREVPVNYSIVGRESEFEATTSKSIPSGTIDNFNYTFNTADIYDLTISVNNAIFTTSYSDEINAVVTIEKFTLENEVIEESLQRRLMVKYTALNRGNNETNYDEWVNTAPINNNLKYPVEFHNILWTANSGWDGESLILKNGATIELPIDLFNTFFGTYGLTFEIDFETFNVQDDSAIIMDYSDPSTTNTSYLKITATEASLNTKNNIFLKTNFKDGTRNKIAFSFNPTARVEDGVSIGTGNPNLVMIYVNGVLDRAAKWGTGAADSDTVEWVQPTTQSIVIGNPEGAAAVKIYSIRIYNSALEPEEEFMNYVVDQGSRIPEIITKNHIYDSTGEISLDLVKANIPTLVLSTDYTKLNNQTNKKSATNYDLQFFCPNQPELNFYVRNGWMSCQGTSSMQYPTKNLRPYFNKTGGSTFQYDLSLLDPVAQQLSNEGINVGVNFNTEFWPYSEYGEENEMSVASYVDREGIAPYAVSSKEIIKDKYFSNAYHEIGAGLSKSYRISLASNYAAKGIDIYYKNGTRTVVKGEKTNTYDRYDIIVANENASVISQIDSIVNAGGSVYISAYRPLLRTGWEIGSDEYWKYVKQLRFSGVKMFTKEAVDDGNGNVGYNFNTAKKLNKNTEYYGLGCYWRQWDEKQRYSGWTDRWTLKADYAESSMTHNGGIGALWGNALRNFKINGQALGMTAAQAASDDPEYIDIRTSCDSKPVVLFVKEPESYDETTGQVKFGSPRFAGLFNIMTDKSSIPLFGFKDIKNEKNELIFDSTNVECWEFLQNGSLIATGMNTQYDTDAPVTYDEDGELLTGEITYDLATSDDNGLNIGLGRPIFTDFEPRWPECGGDKPATEGDPNFYQDDVFGVPSNKFESFWNWLHFCKPAINYTISGIDGYDFNPYVAFKNTAEAIAYRGTSSETPIEGKEIYIQWNNSGNIAYAKEGTEYGLNNDKQIFRFNPNVEGLPLYWLNTDINYEDVSKSINTAKIGDVWNSEVYKVAVEGFDAINRCNETDADGNVSHNDSKAADYLVDVYMKRQGTQYSYENEYGKWVVYNRSSEIDSDSYEASNGVPYSQRTFMQYFEDTMGEHLDLYKVAAYFVYLMRFGAVDQVVKNSMMTTEDGKHWYFINYDNDTTLGVRNDALLIFNWDFDRDTYDYSGNNYAYAGAKSVLWNNLSMSSKFMDIVKSVDNALYSSGLLSSKAVLEYLNEKMCATWNERLYNAQEQIKYLSTFKNNFTTDKFLQFLQGTRKSHREWWVNHRWELFDAMWGTGSYSTKRIKFYEVINEATSSNPIDFMTITSASKYYFTVQKNNATISDGFVELAANDSKTFTTRTNIAIGDPMVFVGPQKVKVLNFRPGVKYLSATLSLNESYKVAGQEGSTTWVKEAGTMMSKLLIGNGTNDSPLTNISGLNDIVSLEEVDIRRCKMLTSTPAVNELNNLHRFRATDAAIALFEPAAGATLYEVSLPSVNASARNEVIVTDEDGNPVQAKNADGSPMVDGDGNPVWETTFVSTVYALQSLILNNVTFMEQRPEDYVVYQENDADALPYTIDAEGHISGIYTDEKAYKYTEESKAIFDVQPTTRLSNVVFNNVVGLDTKKFVMDWKNVILSNTESLTTRSVTLTNIDWEDITVSELIEFVFGKDIDDNNVSKFNIVSFTGKVNVKSDDIDPETGLNKESINITEYNRLIKYFGEDVFTAGNALVITTGENIFYQPTADTKTTFAELDPTSVYYTIASSRDIPVYEFIRGNEFKVKATIFPNNGYDKVYVLNGWNANGTDRTITHSSTVYSDNGTRVTLTTNADGSATLTAEDATVYSNCLYSITICDVINGEVQYNSTDRYEPSKNIYVIPTNRIIPVARNVKQYIDNEATVSVSINDENKHTVRFDLGESTNAPVESIDINIPLQYTNYITVDNENFRLENNQLEVDFNVNIPEYTIENAEVRFTINFESSRIGASVEKSMYVSIVPIVATHIELYDANNVAITNGSKYNISKTGEYEFTVKILSDREDGYYNVPIDNSTFDINTHIGSWNNNVEITPLDEDNKFKVTVTQSGSYKSFTRADFILIRLYNKFDRERIYPIEFSVDIYESIVYPDNTYIAIQNYEGDYTQYIATGSSDNEANIYLLNEQGTTTSSPVKLIEGQDHIKVKVLAKDVQMLDTLTSQQIYVQPTEDYNINIEVTSIVSANGEDIENVAATVVNGGDGHGNDTIELKVPALSMRADTLTIKGNYSLSYDRDGNIETTEDAINTSYPFVINVYHLVASAKTYTKLSIGELYLVDEDSNYYSVEDLDTTDTTSLNNITNAAASGVRFVAAGFTVQEGSATIKPYFALLRDNAVVDYNNLTGFIPRDRSTLNDGSSLNEFDWAMQQYYVDSNNNQIRQFVGNYNTEYWVENILGDSSTWQTSKLNKIYNLYDRSGAVKAFIPTYNELSALIGSNKVFINKYNSLVIYLNTVLGTNYITIDDSIVNLSDVTYGVSNTDLPQTGDFYWFITTSSKQYNPSNNLITWLGIPGTGDNVNTLTIRNTQIGTELTPEYVTRTSILPFVKTL